jgi:putative ABC transport system substrate-binding protein
MRRREFIGLLGSAAVWPLAASAQQPSMPAVGLLRSASLEESATQMAAFRKGLNEVGFIEGQNFVLEYRSSDDQQARFPALAIELVRRQVAVIVAGSMGAALAAKSATTTIPVVFSIGADPVQFGLVASLNRPGGNITGVTQLNNTLAAKQLEVLHELMPNVATVALLINPTTPNTDTDTDAFQKAAQALGLKLIVLNVSSERELEPAFAALRQQHAGALVVAVNSLLNTSAEQFLAFAARHAVPAVYPWPELVTAGGLMSYGTSVADAYRQVGVYTGRILKGEKPADLPVQQAAKVELILNLKTAKTLGLSFPITLLGRADEVIE